MALEDLNHVVKHREVDRYLRGNFFHQIRFLVNTKVYACCISIGERPREGQIRLRSHTRYVG